MFLKRFQSRDEGTTRDRVCSHLQSLGIAASQADQGRPEEQYGAGEYPSEGLVDISGGAISWINVLTGGDSKHLGQLICGVPSSDLSRIGNILLWSMRVKRFPLFGGVVGLRWESFGRLPYALRSLDEDELLKRQMAQHLKEDIEIRSLPTHRYWLLAVGRRGLLHLPTQEEWTCYQSVASMLARLS